jgi:hypothetical protein
MTCGGSHEALLNRKGDSILAYCIAACKTRDGCTMMTVLSMRQRLHRNKTRLAPMKHANY